MPTKLLVPRQLQGNPPAGELSDGQRLLAPHVAGIEIFWSVLLVVVLVAMIARTFGRPLLGRFRLRRLRDASPLQQPDRRRGG